ncbi:MAG: hypothetical protein DRJ61_07295 [Acidobacteria bacterium]|nr:MAG: hypothetical protein DRJ65_22220 [Acidobacteriota bacterium]RLE33426.1 MAG: hypothetical protein DRJ61_07295 [Acidobacteriota bacterium]
MKLFLVLAMTLAVAPVIAGQEVPNVIIERHWFHGDRAVRVTLFDNQMAVTTVREKGNQVFFRQMTLDDGEYEIYIKAFAEVAGNVGAEGRDPLGAIDSGAKISLNLPGFAPSSFSYSPIQMLDLPTARLVAVLDDLQQRVTEVSPSEEALRLWVPAVDDQVELFVGGTATVTEVRENGLLIMQQSGTGIILVVPREEWSMIILKVLPRSL